MRIVPAILLALLSSGVAAAPPALEPGNWMFSIETTTNGRPEPARVGEECLDAQLKDLGAYFSPKLEGVETQCETAKDLSRDRTLEYRMNCKGAGFTMEARTRVTIEDSRRVTVRMLIDTRTIQGTVKVVSVGEALRTGRCRKR